MIFAAGLGTRLRPLTCDRPKALVELSGRTLLEITLARLRAFDIREVIVNAHHFADKIHDYLSANRSFDMRIEISREDELLETGGGLKKTAWFFLEDALEKDASFLVHNVDVLSNIDLAAMTQFHKERRALATVAVQSRPTSRPLLFDKDGALLGRGTGNENVKQSARAFCGIHIISPRIFAKITEEGAFSIIDTYVRLAAQGESIVAFDADRSYWRDLGRPEHITRAEQDVLTGAYTAN